MCLLTSGLTVFHTHESQIIFCILNVVLILKVELLHFMMTSDLYL